MNNKRELIFIDGFDVSGLSSLEKKLIEIREKKYPKESKVFLRKEGTKLRKLVLSRAKRKVIKRSGNLFKGIKRGRIYKKNGSYATDVYGKDNNSHDPHIHLVDKGHRMIGHKPRKRNLGKKVKGKEFFNESYKEFKNEYYKDIDDFVFNAFKL